MEEDRQGQQIQSNEQQESKICPLCNAPHDLEAHIPLCPSITPPQVHSKQTYFIIDDHGIICRKCWMLMPVEKWESHRKSRRQYCLTGTKSQQGSKSISHIQSRSSYVSNSSFNIQAVSNPLAPIVPQHQYPISNNEPVQDMEQAGSDQSKDLVNIATSILTPLIKQWVQRHRTVPPNVLVVYLTSETLNFGTAFLTKEIILPTWQIIESKGGPNVNWKSIIQLPQNLFNDTFINRKLDSITSPRKKVKIIRGLNKLAQAYPGLVKKRQIPKITYKKKQRSYVSFRDVVSVLEHMFASRKRSVVHVALDLYLILLSSQRFLADRNSLQNGIIALLERNTRVVEGGELILTFPLFINKTGADQEVVLSQQLVRLLLAFNWKGWSNRTERLVRRMKEWLGINGYLFKSTMMDAVTKFSSDLRAAKGIAGHRSQSSTRHYTTSSSFRDVVKIVQEIAVPNIHQKFGSYDEQKVREIYENLRVRHLRYEQFKPNWFQQLLARIYGSKFQSRVERDQIVDFLVINERPSQQQKQQSKKSQSQNEENIEQKREQRREASGMQAEGEQSQVPKERIEEVKQILKQSQSFLMDIDDMMEELERKYIAIQGVSYDYTNSQFYKLDFFCHVKGYDSLNCFYCRTEIEEGETRLVCNWCQADYHQACTKNICDCSYDKFKIAVPQLPVDLHQIANTAHNQNFLVMPKQYIHSSVLRQEEQIRILIAARHFRYTRMAVWSPGRNLDISSAYSSEIATLPIIHLPEYRFYLQGQYFPPIQIRPVESYQPHPLWGTEWGVFSTQRIEKDVVLAEYACDVLAGTDLILCKKFDSMFRYLGEGSPSDLFLSPKDYMGWVPLVNHAPKGKENCRTLRAIINGCIRVLLITIKVVNSGQQLFYDYGTGYKRKTKFKK